MDIWVTGDFHREVRELYYRCQLYDIQPGDLVIVTGDDCLNIYGGVNDMVIKKQIDDWGIEFLFVNGNHQNKPENIATYTEYEWNGGKVLKENSLDGKQDIFPHLHFAVDGEIYNIDGKTVAVCGGAYSVDKYIRSYKGACMFPVLTREEGDKLYKACTRPHDITKEDVKELDKICKKVPSQISFWWKDEQPSADTKKKFEQNLASHNWYVDVVISHTAPIQFEPTETFLPGINQAMVDKKTERWLGKIEKRLDYDVWYAGHYHTNKTVNEHFQFLYEQVVPLGQLIKKVK